MEYEFYLIFELESFANSYCIPRLKLGGMSDPSRDEPADLATRRTVLEAAGAASAAGALATLFAGGAAAQPITPPGLTDDPPEPADPADPDSLNVFPQSVASGGPTPTGVIVWTRINPDHIEQPNKLDLEVAHTPDFESPLVTKLTNLEVSNSDDYTVRVDLNGELEANEEYYYRFIYGDAASPVGRCQTLPEPDADIDEVRFAVATCNNFLQGYFGAYSHIAEEEVDFLIHLGDLIYENAGDGMEGRSIELPSGENQAWELADFRVLHQTYRSDRDMQRAFEQHTLIHTWDDHEIVNNRWWNYEEDAPETTSHPQGNDPEFMRQLHVEGIKALTEYVPFRVQYDPDADSIHEQFRLYRSFEFGGLAELFMTDERLYRTPPPEDELGQRDFATPPSPVQDDPDRWMLGSTQRDWLINGMDTTDATWKLWGNEVLNAALKIVNLGEDAVYINYDAWDGYEHERLTLMGEFARRNVENLIAITGDMHTYIAAYLKLDYKDLTQTEHLTEAGRVGVELMTPSISSDNLADSGLFPPARQEESFNEAAQTQNPHIEWINSNNYGYSVLTLTEAEARYTAYAVPRTPDGAGTQKETLNEFRVPEGEPILEEHRSDFAVNVDGDELAQTADPETVTNLVSDTAPLDDIH